MTPKLIRSLGGTVLLATGLFASATAGAEPIHYWQFEESPGLLADSIGGASLTNSSAVAAPIPGAGRGSRFADVPVGNATAAEVAGAGERLTVILADAPSGDFTIEVLAHFDALAGSFGEHIAGTAESQSNVQIGWGLQFRFGTNTLALIVCIDAGCELIDSGLTPEIGRTTTWVRRSTCRTRPGARPGST